jgi:hypothetical protein
VECSGYNGIMRVIRHSWVVFPIQASNVWKKIDSWELCALDYPIRVRSAPK